MSNFLNENNTNSLRKYLNDNDIIGSIRFQLNHPDPQELKFICIVEGDDDIKLFRKFFNRNIQLEEISGGCKNLEKELIEYNKKNDRVFGIRDADFMHINKTEPIPNLFLSDYHDIEMQMIKSDEVFSAFVSEFINKEIERFSDFRNDVLQLLIFLSLIRLWNDVNNNELNFKGLGIGDFFDSTKLSINNEKCIENINKRSPNKKTNLLMEDIISMQSNEYDLFQLTNGHDFIRIIELIIAKKDIASSLRTAYSFTEFQKSKLYSDLNSWANSKNKTLFKND